VRIGVKSGIGEFFVDLLQDGLRLLSRDFFGVPYELVLVLVDPSDAFLDGGDEFLPDALELAIHEISILVLREEH
jgi:hypothetical protein